MTFNIRVGRGGPRQFQKFKRQNQGVWTFSSIKTTQIENVSFLTLDVGTYFTKIFVAVVTIWWLHDVSCALWKNLQTTEVVTPVHWAKIYRQHLYCVCNSHMDSPTQFRSHFESQKHNFYCAIYNIIQGVKDESQANPENF